MPTKVYKWNPASEQFEVAAEWHEDATVLGDGQVATRLRMAVQVIEDKGEDPASFYDNIRRRLIINWDNGVSYRVEWS